MRAPRIILVLVALVVAFACLAPARWFSPESTPSPAPKEPPDVTLLVHIAILAFFVAALFVPRLRPRWGGRQSVGIVATGQGRRAFKETGRASRMNFMTCYGMVLGIAGVTLELCSGKAWKQALPPAFGIKVGLIGALIFLVGAVFTSRGDAQTKTTFLDTGKTVRRRGYYDER
jgi:hypothetical protein